MYKRESFYTSLHPCLSVEKVKTWPVKLLQVSDPDKAVLDLEQEVGGLCLRRFVDDTTTVPEHLRIPLDRLETYFNQQLNLHSSGTDMQLHFVNICKEYSVHSILHSYTLSKFVKNFSIHSILHIHMYMQSLSKLPGSRSPLHLIEFQCPLCAMIWFGHILPFQTFSNK